MSEKIKIICVVGPTASGKTALGVEIAKAVGGEVVSADSMQIYKDMHIASAAADESEMQGIKHHLLEFVPYGEKFTVYDYLLLAREKAQEISLRGKVPVFVGGTGLYINSLVDNINLIDTKTDFELRKKLEDKFDTLGGEEMLKKLYEIDSDAARNLHPNDKKRIVRAFEIYESTGLTKTRQNILSKAQESPFDATIIGITYKDREKLYQRINERVDIMLKNGLEAEAKAAYLKKSNETAGAVQAIGHKELFPYFENKITLSEAVETIKLKTRHYAKRQLTWFNAREDIIWLYKDEEDVSSKAEKILESKGYRIEKQ